METEMVKRLGPYWLLKGWARRDAQAFLRLLSEPFSQAAILLPRGYSLELIEPSGMMVEVSTGQKWVEFR